MLGSKVGVWGRQPQREEIMKKLLTAVVLCGLLGLSAGMLAQPAISADDAQDAAASGGSDSGDAKAPPADEGDTSSMGAEPAADPAQGDAPPDDKGAADPDGAKE
jgi:hypothetical protein